VLDLIVEHYETKTGPHVGARAIARAWVDSQFKAALLDDATKAIATLGVINRVGEHLITVENTPTLHNMVVCTLCSCYPWDVLGLPPVWYKSAPYTPLVFEGRELWGENADPTVKVSIEAFEPYLEPA
jgi:nitrile hydratase